MNRTHFCGELFAKQAGKRVVLCGWVSNRRLHGGLLFIDLRDRTGITQVVFNPKKDKVAFEQAKGLGSEFVVQINGLVLKRPKGTENKGLSTGEIEVVAEKVVVLNESLTPPLEVTEWANANEDTRLTYRYLDLRRLSMQKNLRLRHRIVKTVRDYFDANGFLEIETPILAKSTPEGARDYLVPSRVHRGRFFALPQSPQIFKQLLMVGGCDRYFQIAKCFRDEDLRADRQPEFSQVDVEMSFIEEEDIFELIEGLFAKIFEQSLSKKIKVPFPRMTYAEAMGRFGSDKPDTRFGLELIEVTDLAKESGFEIFKGAVKNGGIVFGINATGAGEFSKKELEELTELSKVHHAKGLAWIKVSKEGFDSPIAKFFSNPLLQKLSKKMDAKENDLLLFVADKPKIVFSALGNIRLFLGKKLGLAGEKLHNFLWVTDFPLFEWNEGEQRPDAVHHPFTSPREEDIPLLETDPLKVRSRAYDIVLNGVEVGGGSIRIHRSDLQKKMFSRLKLSDETTEKRFGFLLEAFKYGAPPHGGIALGVDRICMMLAGAESIREVIAFPKNKAAVSLLEGSPSEVDEKQLRELKIRFDA